jgi:hypothetical protein
MNPASAAMLPNTSRTSMSAPGGRLDVGRLDPISHPVRAVPRGTMAS